MEFPIYGKIKILFQTTNQMINVGWSTKYSWCLIHGIWMNDDWIKWNMINGLMKWEGFIPPIDGDLGDGLLSFYLHYWIIICPIKTPFAGHTPMSITFFDDIWYIMIYWFNLAKSLPFIIKPKVHFWWLNLAQAQTLGDMPHRTGCRCFLLTHWDANCTVYPSSDTAISHWWLPSGKHTKSYWTWP